jgi:thiol-disulfide isomerase/thioredoxin
MEKYNEYNESYNTDIEMVVDFMKLSILFDKNTTSINDKQDIIKLQQSILETLPAAQSERMAAIYKMMNNIYLKNKQQAETFSQRSIFTTQTNPIIISRNLNKKADHFIVLFYKSSCPVCQSIMSTWNEFKRQHQDSNFTVLDYDINNANNVQLFKYFNILQVPTIIKLQLDKKEGYIEKFQGTISLDSLHQFSNFY